MPHVNIKYFECQITDDQKEDINNTISKLLQSIFECDDEVISIALEPIHPEKWKSEVYLPEIINRSNLLNKVPQY
ncbi:tautomerase family protein [Acinetobacter baumannii]|nr:tautomerase family protein [Acinetobacter baumannii]MDO7463851.1 tautomerase family protein [Acinetobacter baumannii]